MVKRVLSCLLALPLILSCTLEMAPVSRSYDCFSAIIDNQGVKTQLGSDGSVTWSLGDAITVFSDTDPEGQVFTRGEDGKFYSPVAVSGNTFYAYYVPEFASREGMRINQNWFGPIIGRENVRAPMAAVSQSNVLSFKQTCGIIHINFTAPGSWHTVYLTSNAGETVYGDSYIDMSEDVPAMHFSTAEGAWLTNFTYTFQDGGFSSENGCDLYFLLPQGELSQGFSLRILGDDKPEFEKKTNKSVTISRGQILSYSVTYSGIDDKTAERNALIDLYNALDGDNWTDNTNWCSEEPVTKWFGVMSEDGQHVTRLNLDDNNLSGEIPESITDLKYLTHISITEDNRAVSGYERIFGIQSLVDIYLGNCTNRKNREDLRFEIPSSIGKLKSLKTLNAFGVKGSLPEEFYSLPELSYLDMRSVSFTEPMSSKIGQLSKLTYLSITADEDKTVMTGPLPDEFYGLTGLTSVQIVGTGLSGSLSSKIGALQNLYSLNLTGNQLTGSLPAELATIDFIGNASKAGVEPFVALFGNFLSGNVPESFAGWDAWDHFWSYIIAYSELNYATAPPHIVTFDVETLDGNHFTSSDVASNELTVFYSWDSTSCPISITYAATLDELYNTYKDKGLDIVGWSVWEDETTIRSAVSQNGWQWRNFNWQADTNQIGPGWYSFPWMATPSMAVYDKNGALVFEDVITSRSDFVGFVKRWFGDAPYESTDYSRDGKYVQYQTATEGAGIDIVLMGDAYSDREIASGKYAEDLKTAAENFFGVEPYTSYRNMFNVYLVDVVSKNEGYAEGHETALSGVFGEGTLVSGDHAKANEYAKAVVGQARMNNVMVIVIMNRDYYAGTCYMSGAAYGDYGYGPSISYFPASSDPVTYAQLIHHEAGGHGFAKLGDEYAYESMGAIPDDEKEKFLARVQYGWWKNVDLTGDPAAVKWANFLTDERYAGEGLGVFEGGYTYWTGVWRPTDNSIMRYNYGGFNAPSREAIWYRLHKLAYGDSWVYNREDFVSWDTAKGNIKPHNARRVGHGVRKPMPPLAPPVLLEWKEMK